MLLLEIATRMRRGASVVATDTRQALNGSNRATFYQELDRHDAALCLKVVCHAECRLVIFRVRLSARNAAKALEPVAVLSEALAGNAAHGAGHRCRGLRQRFHISILHHALAVGK